MTTSSFKCHYIAALATCDPSFPMTKIKEIIPTAELTLNLLRTSRRSPSTAYEELHGQFDSNRYDMHPPGTKVVTLDDAQKRSTFAPHGPVAYYLGIDRCYRVYVPDKDAIRISDSLSWVKDQPLAEKYPILSSAGLHLCNKRQTAIRQPVPYQIQRVPIYSHPVPQTKLAYNLQHLPRPHNLLQTFHHPLSRLITCHLLWYHLCLVSA